MAPYVSLVIPVYNEEENLSSLFTEVEAVLSKVRRESEIIFVDDGSTDRSREILMRFVGRRRIVRVVYLVKNCGQHTALLVGFAHAGGEIIVTLDADLQNPPEEIPRLLETIEEGYDVVGGWRQGRSDPLVRRLASHLMNRVASRIAGRPMHDYGCMLRAYRRGVVESLLTAGIRSPFIPVLANRIAARVAEVPVAHRARAGGKSKYTVFRLILLSVNLLVRSVPLSSRRPHASGPSSLLPLVEAVYE